MGILTVYVGYTDDTGDKFLPLIDAKVDCTLTSPVYDPPANDFKCLLVKKECNNPCYGPSNFQVGVGISIIGSTI
jgi:hypothetical protein